MQRDKCSCGCGKAEDKDRGMKRLSAMVGKAFSVTVSADGSIDMVRKGKLIQGKVPVTA